MPSMLYITKWKEKEKLDRGPEKLRKRKNHHLDQDKNKEKLNIELSTKDTNRGHL